MISDPAFLELSREERLCVASISSQVVVEEIVAAVALHAMSYWTVVSQGFLTVPRQDVFNLELYASFNEIIAPLGGGDLFRLVEVSMAMGQGQEPWAPLRLVVKLRIAPIGRLRIEFDSDGTARWFVG